MSELIKDPVYRKFLTTPPKMPALASNKDMMSSPPWVVYVQRKTDGPWGKREFWKYAKALKFMNHAMRLGVHDCTINNKRQGFDPPQRLVRIKGKYVIGSDNVRRQATKLTKWVPPLGPDDPQHHWCRYCRRPTVFKYFAAHKRLGQVDATIPRCTICGASARIALAHEDRFFRVH